MIENRDNFLLHLHFGAAIDGSVPVSERKRHCFD